MNKLKKLDFLNGLFIVIFIFIGIELNSFDFKKKKPEIRKSNVFTNKIFDITFINWPSVRSIEGSRLGTNLADIESHLPPNHAYSHEDLITWGHESTHGINANIRNSQERAWAVNGFYCLRDRAVVLEEPNTKISKVSPRVPMALRGPSYDLYLRQQTKHWDDRPLYILDEWIAYTNGVEVGLEMDAEGWDFELLQAHNFNIYAISLAMEIHANCPDYDDLPFSGFVKWNIERVMSLTEKAKNKKTKNLERTENYLSAVRNDAQSAKLREFCKGYFGNEWCKQFYNF